MAHPVDANPPLQLPVAQPVDGRAPLGQAPVGVGAAPSRIEHLREKGLLLIAKDKWDNLWKVMSNFLKNCLMVCFPPPRDGRAEESAKEVIRVGAQTILHQLAALGGATANNPADVARLLADMRRSAEDMLNIHIPSLRREAPQESQVIEGLQEQVRAMLADIPLLGSVPQIAPLQPTPEVVAARARIGAAAWTIIQRLPPPRRNPPGTQT